MSDDPNAINPATIGTLVRLMLGGLPTGRVGYPLHCRLRYFDPERRRAGIPEDVGALVEAMDSETVTVTLVNLDQVREKKLIVQGGACGEHRIVRASAGQSAGEELSVGSSHFAVTLAPGCTGRIVIDMNRYANQPTLAYPWG